MLRSLFLSWASYSHIAFISIVIPYGFNGEGDDLRDIGLVHLVVKDSPYPLMHYKDRLEKMGAEILEFHLYSEKNCDMKR